MNVTAQATRTESSRGWRKFLLSRLRPSRWRNHALTFQFFLIGGVVAMLGMLVVGSIVAGMIERAVTRNAGAATALYVDGMIAPLLPDMMTGGILDDPVKRALDETLNHGALRDRVAELRLWAPDGRILYADDPALIGARRPLPPETLRAFEGKIQTAYNPGGGGEGTRVLSGPLLSISNPVLQPWSGEVVAVVELVEYADELASTLASARRRAWFTVLGTTFMFFMALAAVVMRGSRTIVQQSNDLTRKVAELTSLLEENRSLRRRVEDAARKSATLNESFLRRIGADLHDGPAQLISLAALRLDSPAVAGRDAGEAGDRREIDAIRDHLDEALAEIRGICRGLVLPQIENADALATVRTAIEDHERRSGQKVEPLLEGNMPPLPESHRICIYRFVQEALNNSYKHAPGSRQSVRLSTEGRAIVLAVCDDGAGFDEDRLACGGIGLAGLKERVQSLGGEFSLSTGRGGTRVEMKLIAKE
mgnify:CR=1 FL=1